MNPAKLIAVLLIVGGVLGLAYGGFSYISETHRADIGPLHLTVSERQTVSIPLWASLVAIVVGAAVLIAAKKP